MDIIEYQEKKLLDDYYNEQDQEENHEKDELSYEDQKAVQECCMKIVTELQRPSKWDFLLPLIFMWFVIIVCGACGVYVLLQIIGPIK